MIRPATKADAPAIAAIWNDAIRNTTITFNPVEKPDEEVRAMITDATPCLVYEDARGVMGFARYFPFRSGEGYRFSVEHTIMLHPDLRGKGAGRALLGAICELAQAAGKHSIYAGVSAENPSAVAFHEKMGFTTVAILPEVGHKFGRWIDLVLMYKRL